MTTEIGEVEVADAEGPAGTFEPATVPKHQRRLDGLTGNVISLYAKGMTTGDIQAHLAEIYGTEISRETISKITDAIVEDMVAWQNRPLDPLYAVMLIDAIVIKVRGSQVANRPVYVAIGVNLDGERDVLGLWLGPSGGEGAKQWATMLTELRNRGVADALIVCCDGLKGLPESIRTTWPDATVQTCVVHMVRNSLRYASEEALAQIVRRCARSTKHPPSQPPKRFAEFSDHWADIYPAMIRSWENSWAEFVPFLEFPAELRKVVYTTNAIESLNARFRRAVRHRGHFPNEQAATEGPLPGRHAAPAEPPGPHRPDQRLEDHPQRPYRALRRPDRRPHLMNTITPGYTKNLTDPPFGPLQPNPVPKGLRIS